MSKPSVEEILLKLHQKQACIEHSYEEVTRPNYALWATARAWSFSQATCLISGLVPLTCNLFFFLVREQDPIPLETIAPSYPISPIDLTRLQNVYRIIGKSGLLTGEGKDQRNYRITPSALIDYCQKHQNLEIILPQQLVDAVRFGPHLSLDLPDCYCPLEIQVPPTKLSLPPIPPEPALSIVSRLFPLQNFDKWKRTDNLTICEAVLLHYNIEPTRLLTCPDERLPDLPSSKAEEELLLYIRQYCGGTVHILNVNLDEDHLFYLLDRAWQAGIFGSSTASSPSPYKTHIKTFAIVEWMRSKSFYFPSSDNEKYQNAQGNESFKEQLLNYDLNHMKKDQLAKIIFRAAACHIWKNTKPSPKLSKMWEHLKKTRTFTQELFKKEYDKKTVEDWIRDLNPHYKPKK